MAEIRPQFFLVREDNNIIPLIALDELPTQISIHNVPRNLNVADTRGMTSVGTVPARGGYYIVDGAHQTMGITEAKNDSFAITSFNGKGKGHSHDKKSKNYNRNSPVEEKQEKEFCSYWIRNGECDFEQQGCRFKHVMPKDIDVLSSIGLQDIPVWYREKYNIPSLRPPRARTGAGAGVTQNNWRKPRTTAVVKATEHNTSNDNGNGNGNATNATIANGAAAGALTPETSTGTITDARLTNGSLYASRGVALTTTNASAGANNNNGNKAVIMTNGSSPVTPPNGGRYIDFERVGAASFNYKYGAPQTPTGSGPVRSRRLFEAKDPNHDNTQWDEPLGRHQNPQ